MNYHEVKKCSDHQDYNLTTGDLSDVLGDILYGYHYDSNKQKANIYEFDLFFTCPFDDEYVKKYGDHNGFSKDNQKQFEEYGILTEETTKDKIQKIPLQYDDHTPAVYCDCDHNGEFDRVVPTFKEACTNNIYGDIRKRTFFERLIKRNNPYQIKGVIERSMLYRMRLKLPFDVIAEHITVDKIQYAQNGTEKYIPMYTSTRNTCNKVEDLKKNLNRMQSIMSEIEQNIADIQAEPEKYMRPHEYTATNTRFDPFWKKCHDTDEEDRNTKYNLKNGDHLLKKCKSEFKKMEDVMFRAAWYDVEQDPIDPTDTKCSHNKCNRERAKGSEYCDKCVQLPTKECNFCKCE
jgi:hypothetical protein